MRERAAALGGSLVARPYRAGFLVEARLPIPPATGGAPREDTEPADLLQAVRVVARGDALLSPSVTRRLITDLATRPERPPPSDRVLAGLTEREREVLALVAEGLSNDEIAGRLFLSPLTAKTHVSRVMTKLTARDRAQLVVIAYESGLVKPGWL